MTQSATAVMARKTVLEFASEHEAVRAMAILSEAPGWESVPVVAREGAAEWFVECYDDGALIGESARSVIGGADLQIISETQVDVPQADWVTETQKMLPPIRAGRFIVHGSHDRLLSKWAIEIDAGRAFGTAHHSTTKGCLLAIGGLPAKIHARFVLDLGSGSGVLAIAAAKTFSHGINVTAVDIDPIAIEVALDNAKKNGASASIRLFVGDGLKPSLAYRAAPFDIVVANILARPLLKLAPRLRSLTQRGGILILSGLLAGQAREVLARYGSTGFRLMTRRDLDGWTTVTLRRAT